jgi:hypothetical protein
MQAWVLPAILRPDRLTLFSLYALLYAAPLLKEGFEVEKYTIVMLILGQIHIQVRSYGGSGNMPCWSGNAMSAVS